MRKIYCRKKYFYSYFSLLKGFPAIGQVSSLQREHTAFQNMKLHIFLFLWVSFILLDPDPDSQLRIRIHRPNWIRIQSGSGTLESWTRELPRQDFLIFVLLSNNYTSLWPVPIHRTSVGKRPIRNYRKVTWRKVVNKLTFYSYLMII